MKQKTMEELSEDICGGIGKAFGKPAIKRPIYMDSCGGNYHTNGFRAYLSADSLEGYEFLTQIEPAKPEFYRSKLTGKRKAIVIPPRYRAVARIIEDDDGEWVTEILEENKSLAWAIQRALKQ